MQFLKLFSSTLVILLLTFIFTNSALSKVGVGVGTGKIIVDQGLKPGTIYNLPSLTVFNTGDVPSQYHLSVAYHEKQTELKPGEEWFEFSPDKFFLNPGETKEVNIKLHLPVKVEPGTYFAYIEGSPISVNDGNNNKVGIAAAAKLYFEVTPSSFWEALYYRGLSLWRINQNWLTKVFYVLAAIIFIFVFKKFFNIQINLKKPANK